MPKLILLLALSLAAFATPASLYAQISNASPGGEPLYRLAVATIRPTLANELSAVGYDAKLAPDRSAVWVFASQAEVQSLVAEGLSYTVLETLVPLGQKLSARSGFPGYNNPAAMSAAMAALAANHPTRCRVVNLTTFLGTPQTVEGRDIFALEITSNVLTPEDEPTLLLVTGLHAREIVPPEMALETATQLLNGYGSNPAITTLLDTKSVWIVISANPDGIDYAWNSNNGWRKNRRVFTNGIGVDLNRNYDLGWSPSCNASTNPQSGVYKGPSPESEAETQTLVALMRLIRPSHVMDVHSSGREVLQTYRCASLPSVLETFIDDRADVLAALPSPAFATRDPSADGELYQWAIKEIAHHSYLTELGGSFQPPFAQAMIDIAEGVDVIMGWLMQDSQVTGIIANAFTGAPIDARLDLQGVAFSNGEHRRSRADTGRYQWHLPSGTWSFDVSAPGYVTQNVSVTVPVGTTSAQILDIALLPVGGSTLQVTTTGAGDITLSLSPLPVGTATVLTAFSADTAGPLDMGPLLGLYPDQLTTALLALPANAGHPFVVTSPFAPGQWPNAAFTYPAGTIPPGLTLDGAALLLGSAGALDYSPVVRTSF